MLFVIGCMPGMPRAPFFLLATVLLLTWRATRSVEGPQDLLDPVQEAEQPEAEEAGADDDDALAVEGLLATDRIALEIGYRLIPLVQQPGGNGILDHIAQLRRRFAMKDGIVLPPVRIKDNIRLAPSGYRVLIGGQELARGEVAIGQFLAMDGGTATGPIAGTKTKDPAFGLPAVWIDEALRDEAEVEGYTVIDPTSVLITHLSEIIRSSIDEVLSRDDVKALVENVKKSSPAVVEGLIPERLGYGELQAVLRNLLREGVPIRNMPAILEVVADHAAKVKDPEALSELVRQRLGRALCERHADAHGTLHAVTLDPAIESRLSAAVGGQPDAQAPPVNPAWLSRLVEEIARSVAGATKGGKDVVLLVRSNVRRFLHELVHASLPKVSVLSYNEVVPARGVETLGIVKLEE
jgi:flagellar biosynthesis protein FlhA